MTKAYTPDPVSPEIVEHMAALKANGTAREDLIAEMRKSGLHIVECIKLTRTLYGLSLGDAKEVVHFSAAWAECRDAHGKLHDETLEALLQDGWEEAESRASAA